jgi:hypothetical protein
MPMAFVHVREIAVDTHPLCAQRRRESLPCGPVPAAKARHRVLFVFSRCSRTGTGKAGHRDLRHVRHTATRHDLAASDQVSGPAAVPCFRTDIAPRQLPRPFTPGWSCQSPDLGGPTARTATKTAAVPAGAQPAWELIRRRP